MIFCFVCPTRLVLRRTKTRTKKNRVGYVVINIHHARTHAQQQKHHHREGRRHVEKELKSKSERTRKWYTHAHTQRSSTTMRRLFCPFLPFLSRPPPPPRSPSLLPSFLPSFLPPPPPPASVFLPTHAGTREHTYAIYSGKTISTIQEHRIGDYDRRPRIKSLPRKKQEKIKSQKLIHGLLTAQATTNQPTNQSINRQFNQPINQLIVNQPTGQSTDQ